MSSIEHIGTDRETECELYVLELATPDDLPRTFDTAGKYSTILIVWDATDVAADTISRFACHLIDAGGTDDIAERALSLERVAPTILRSRFCHTVRLIHKIVGVASATRGYQNALLSGTQAGSPCS